MAFDSSLFRSGLGSLLGGIFGNSGNPYESAMNQYQNYANMGQGVQQPYLDSGTRSLGNYEKWLQNQQNPSAFINKLVGQYKESPYTSYLQQQAQNAGINAGSADGTTGSSALMQQLQQNSTNIAQQGLDSWLQKVLGINTQYGQGEQNLISGGQSSANQLLNMYNQLAQLMGDASYGKEAGKNSDWSNTIGGIGGIIGSFL